MTKVFVLKFTEAEAQKALDIFEWTVRNGGLPIAKEVIPIAEKFMQAAVKAKEADEAAKTAAAKTEEPVKN
jgi:plasmid stabilization system protein ParE